MVWLLLRVGRPADANIISSYTRRNGQAGRHPPRPNRRVGVLRRADRGAVRVVGAELLAVDMFVTGQLPASHQSHDIDFGRNGIHVYDVVQAQIHGTVMDIAAARRVSCTRS